MTSITREATAVWTGSGKDGNGTLSSQSGVLHDTAYSFATRFGERKGTNPEELIAAAHAGCFTMALAFRLSGAGHAPQRLETKADLAIVQEGAGWRIAGVKLDLKGKVPGISKDEFLRLAEEAKKTCPVSQVLRAEITLNAELLQ